MAAVFGTIQLSNGANIWSIDSYHPDAVATLAGFNMTGLSGSGSDTKLVVPFDGFITDIVLAAAPTAVGCKVVLDNVEQPGTAFRYANLLSSVVTRSPVRVPVRKGQTLQLLQY